VLIEPAMRRMERVIASISLKMAWDAHTSIKLGFMLRRSFEDRRVRLNPERWPIDGLLGRVRGV
jgi:hypothetical protein